MKQNNAIRDILSIGVAHPLKMLVKNKCIAVGTGFFYSYRENLFLITAGHNITGTNPETKESMGMPEEMAIFLYSMENKQLAGWTEYKVNLKNEDGESLWKEHPNHGSDIDVMAIPVKLKVNDGLKAINKISLDEDLPIDIGMDVFILGYPHGYVSAPTITPIWKRGSLATEYAINIGGKPKMYVDSATAKGMSGAPIIAQQAGYYPVGKDGDLGSYVFGRGRKFLGVYTGRRTDEVTADIKSDIFNAQLGIAWKESVITEILSA